MVLVHTPAYTVEITDGDSQSEDGLTRLFRSLGQALKDTAQGFTDDPVTVTSTTPRAHQNGTSVVAVADEEMDFEPVGERQMELLKLLSGAGDEGLTDKEIRKALKLHNNYELAGLMGGIARSAKRQGLVFEDVIIKIAIPDGIRYRLTPGAKAIAEQIA